MNTAANTLRRLAPCTSLPQCAHRAQKGSYTTANCIRKSPHRKSHCRRITGFHPQQRRNGPQNHSPQLKMLFNIHNPSQDHRDRAACAFLLTP